MAYDYDYAPVTTPEDEEERRQQQQYPAAIPASPLGTTRTESPIAPSPLGTPRTEPFIKPSPLGSPISDIASSSPAVAPTLAPQRPQWKDYAPAEPHGWSKFGHVLASFQPALNYWFNQRPQLEAQRAYKTATEEYEAPGKEAQQEATTKETEARAGKETAETEALKNPQPKVGATPEEQFMNDALHGDKGNPRMDAKGKPYTYLTAHAAWKQTEQEAKPEQAPHVTYDQGVPVSVTAGNKTYDINDPKLPPELKPLVESANRAHSQHTKETVDQQARSFAQANEMFNKKDTAEREKDVRKQYDTARDADERLDRMKASYTKGLKGDQQAMLALLTDHIGMTLGMQKGARITKDILNEATQSQPWLSKIGAKFDDRGYLSGVALGPDQMRQMLDLGYEARNRQWKRSFGDSQMYNVPEPPGARNVYKGERHFDQDFGNKGGEAPEGTVIDVNGQKQVKRGGKWVPQ